MKSMRRFRSTLLAPAMLGSLCSFVDVVNAQTVVQMPTPLEVKAIDENGVDIATGFVNFSVEDVEIGPLKHAIYSVDNVPTSPGNENAATNSGFRRYLTRDNFTGGARYAAPVNPGGNTTDPRPRVSISVADVSGTFFQNSDGTYAAFNGGSLTDNSCVLGQSGSRTFVSRQGAIVNIDCRIQQGKEWGSATKITYPNGMVIDINYKTYTLASGYLAARIQSVTRSDGFMLKYNYAVNGVPTAANATAGWSDLTGVTAVNLSVDYCDPLADQCSYSQTWPSATYLWSNSDRTLTVTDQRGLSTRYTLDSYYRVTAVKPRTSAVDKITYQYCSRVPNYDCQAQVASGLGGSTPPVINVIAIKDRVRSVTYDGRTWTYDFPTGTYGNYYLPYRSTSPTGKVMFALSSIIGAGSLLTVNDPTRGIANFQNTEVNRTNDSVVPGRPKETYTYGPRGNVTATGFVTAEYPNSSNAAYPEGCPSPKTCNQPTWIQDANGNKTWFTYDDRHGGVTAITLPSVEGGAPQKRLEYAKRKAWIRAQGGGYVAGDEIWLLTATSECRSSAATGVPSAPCSTAGDEIRTTYLYGPDAGPNNLLVRGVQTAASGKVRTECYLYDPRAQRIAETRAQDGSVSCP